MHAIYLHVRRSLFLFLFFKRERRSRTHGGVFFSLLPSAAFFRADRSISIQVCFVAQLNTNTLVCSLTSELTEHTYF